MLVVAVWGIAAVAAPSATTTHGPASTSLDGQIRTSDLIAGLIATELPGDNGWHPANANPADQLPAFTDGVGILASGLTGLLNDFPGAGNPTKRVQYDLAGPSDVGLIQILTGNNGKDGRVFSTSAIYTSTDGSTFNLLGYFQSDPSGTINSGQWGSTLVKIVDDSGGPLATGVTNIQFDLYSVDNTGGQNRDPYDGVNPFTGADDGLTAAFVSPLVFEIDVAIPEPSTALLVGCGLVALWSTARRKR
jgi:hypothetical protein